MMLLLNHHDIASLLDLDDYISVVEQAFKLHAEGKALKTGLLHVNARDGEFHVKAGGLQLRKTYFGVKVNGGFFQNQHRFGMPNIQGAIYLADAENGLPLALMDSREITMKRTGAATAVAAKYLARPGASVVTIFGCGTQGRIQLEALTRVLPIKEAFAYSRNREKATRFAEEVSGELQIRIRPVADLDDDDIQASDVFVTCTPAKRYFLRKEHVRPGTFIAAVGADSPDKRELEPALLASSKVVVDILDQCERVGELHHAIAAGLMTRESVHAELGEIIAGKKPGRTSAEEITIFDSTGTALQDIAAAAAIYEKATAIGTGTHFNLSGIQSDFPHNEEEAAVHELF
jgi:ornithine cyclodeaminase/alanine dehydrogenase